MMLKDAVVIVTGASQGIGRAMAELFSSQGATVIGCSRSAANVTFEHAQVDVTDAAQVKKFVSDVVETHGRVDILINNAGALHAMVPIEQISQEEYEKTMKTNVDGVFYFLQAVVPVMKQQNDGFILNVSSGAGRHGFPNLSVYAASKHAVHGLTESVAMELEKTPIRVVALCPGGVNTPMRASAFGDEDAQKQQSAQTVAQCALDIVTGKIDVKSGGEVHIRHGEITQIRSNI